VNPGTLDAIANGGIALPGTHNYTEVFVMPPGGAGSVNFVFNFNYTTGNIPHVCSDTIDLCLDDCLGRSSKTNVVANSIKQNAELNGYLWIYPSIASNSTNVKYQFPDKNTSEQLAKNTQRQILLYNDRGEIAASYNNITKKGVLQMNVGQLPKGLYLVQMVENGIVKQTEKLMVIR
jgi:hypothetical protein